MDAEEESVIAALRRTIRSFARLAPVLLLLAAARTIEPTLFIAGDSTAAMKLPEKRAETGWGEELQAWFESGTAHIDDRAKNGRSTLAWFGQRRAEGRRSTAPEWAADGASPSM